MISVYVVSEHLAPEVAAENGDLALVWRFYCSRQDRQFVISDRNPVAD
jgi:hypothetical protein